MSKGRERRGGDRGTRDGRRGQHGGERARAAILRRPSPIFPIMSGVTHATRPLTRFLLSPRLTQLQTSPSPAIFPSTHFFLRAPSPRTHKSERSYATVDDYNPYALDKKTGGSLSRVRQNVGAINADVLAFGASCFVTRVSQAATSRRVPRALHLLHRPSRSPLV